MQHSQFIKMHAAGDVVDQSPYTIEARILVST